MKRKQVMSLVLAAVMAMSLLTGCGGKEKEADAPKSSAPETETNSGGG